MTDLTGEHVGTHTGEAVHTAELRAINERLLIASVRQQELAETALKSGELYRLLARNIPDGIVLLFDHDLRHLLADGRGLSRLHLSKERLEGTTIWESFPPEVCEQIEPAFRAALAGETVFVETVFSVEQAAQENHETTERSYHVQALPIRDDSGNIVAGMAMAQDVTEQRHAEKIIRWQAHHDALTGLPNRALLDDRLEQALAHCVRSGDFAALLFLDLDRFKQVNDTLGHATGDRLLQAVARRVKEYLRSEDTVARMGGDEFLVLLPSLRSPEDAALVAQKIANLFATPFRLQGHEITVTASVGYSLFPIDGSDAETLIRHADAAMYRSKQERKARK